MTTHSTVSRIDQARQQTAVAFINECLGEGRHARLGSLGEHLYASLMEGRGNAVEAVHSRQTDFLVDGIRVDVKTTTRTWTSGLSTLLPWRGHRVRGVQYAQVELHPAGARLSQEGALLGELDWPAIELLYRAWAERRATQRKPFTLMEANKVAWAEICDDLEAFFEARGLRCKAIYRTNQESWGKESPANLKLKRWPADLVRVFVSFAGAVDRESVEYVLVIGAEDAERLPMLAEADVALHKPKVDLARLPERMRFRDLQDLLTRWTNLPR